MALTSGPIGVFQITLDSTAAGHGWYLDATPLTNSDDYLPTADANVWRAKPGSAAEGKMDLLSVLLHEYGHVLGLEHSADVRDFMGPALAAGERRLPTDDELQRMAELAAALKLAADNAPSPETPWPPAQALIGLPMLAAGLRRSRPTQAVDKPLFELAANPGLTNGDFSHVDVPSAGSGAGAAGSGAPADWLTSGPITLNQGTAVLGESAGSQTQLTQLFHLGANSRYLSFTLADAGLVRNASGPQDAFEVALVNASTGLPALADGAHTGTVNLTHTDALLNLQTSAEGVSTLRLADGVHRFINVDGSSTFTLELPAGLANQNLALSFDLLGFGQGADATASHISIRDVNLGAVLQASDDAVPSAMEDTPLALDLLVNDQITRLTDTGVQLVQGPAHGQVELGAHGEVNYTPDANYFGTDSFSYRLQDIPLLAGLQTLN